MSKASDILRELEDIGAVGDKVQEVVVRRLVPVPTLPVAEESMPSAAVASLSPSGLLAGFGDQLSSLEQALQGMLNWCAGARELAQEYEQVETGVEECAEPEESEESEESAESATETDSEEGEEEEEEEEEADASVEVEAAEAGATIATPAKPKYTKEELKRLFLDPTFESKEVQATPPSVAEVSHE
jgi:hypothetical protein